MLEQRVNRIRIGDWIKGISKNEYEYQGYVEAISATHGSLLVRVVKSEQQSKVGKVIESHMSRVDLMEEEIGEEQDVYALIELALQTRDEVWFMDLTSHLITLKANKLVSPYMLAIDQRTNMRPFSKG